MPKYLVPEAELPGVTFCSHKPNSFQQGLSGQPLSIPL